METISDDALGLVFEHLPLKEQLTVSPTSKRFKRIASVVIQRTEHDMIRLEEEDSALYLARNGKQFKRIDLFDCYPKITAAFSDRFNEISVKNLIINVHLETAYLRTVLSEAVGVKGLISLDVYRWCPASVLHNCEGIEDLSLNTVCINLDSLSRLLNLRELSLFCCTLSGDLLLKLPKLNSFFFTQYKGDFSLFYGILPQLEDVALFRLEEDELEKALQKCVSLKSLGIGIIKQFGAGSMRNISNVKQLFVRDHSLKSVLTNVIELSICCKFSLKLLKNWLPNVRSLTLTSCLALNYLSAISTLKHYCLEYITIRLNRPCTGEEKANIRSIICHKEHFKALREFRIVEVVPRKHRPGVTSEMTVLRIKIK